MKLQVMNAGIVSVMAAVVAALPAALHAESIYFPHTRNTLGDISGIVDVTKAPYNVNNHGTVDVSTILQQVLDEHKGDYTIYFPNGTYLVSNTLQFMTCNNYCTGSTTTRGPVLQGQSRKGTVIRLKDGTWPAGNEARDVIHTGDGVAQNFDRGIYNMTINIGKNNAGARGVYFYSNNEGMLSDVDIISEDGKGLVGLHLGPDSEQGPTMVRRTFIKGFQQGVFYGGGLNGSVTMSQISLEGQSQYGIVAEAKALYIDSLTSNNQVPAVYARNGGKAVVVRASLAGGSSAQPAVKVDNGCELFARDIAAAGYQRAITSSGTPVAAPAGLTVAEYSSHGIASQFPSPQRSMHLPDKLAPEVAWETDTAKWANFLLYKGGIGTTPKNDRDALQAAIDDPAKTTVIIPTMRMLQMTGTDTVHVRGNIIRIIGTPGNISGGVLSIEDGTAPVVKISRVNSVQMIVRTGRTVVIESYLGANAKADILAIGTGDLYLADMPAEITVDNPRQNVYMWHYDAEWSDGGNLYVKSGKLRLFGWKTEGAREKVWVTGGALELLGFYAYAQLPSPQTYPLITVTNAQFCIAGLVQQSFGNSYTTLVRETRSGVTKDYTTSQNSGRGNMTLYVGYADTTLGGVHTEPAPAITRIAPAAGRGKIALLTGGADRTLLARDNGSAVFNLRGTRIAGMSGPTAREYPTGIYIIKRR